MRIYRVLFIFVLSSSFATQGWTADLVQPDPAPPEPAEETLDHTDHSNCDCGPRSHEAVHGPARIPISKIETASATPVARVRRVSRFNWGTTLLAGAIGAGIGFGAVALYNHWKDSREDEPPSYLPPVPPPTRPYYYGYPPRTAPYYLIGTTPRPVYIRSSPYYPPRHYFLGPPPATLPVIQSPAISYPLYPQSNYFGTSVPIYVPTSGYSGLPLTI